MVENNQKITLLDEDNKENEFTIVDYLEVEDRKYVVLLPDENPDEGAIILRIEDLDGDQILVDIEDDDEFDEVVKFLEEDFEE